MYKISSWLLLNAPKRKKRKKIILPGSLDLQGRDMYICCMVNVQSRQAPRLRICWAAGTAQALLWLVSDIEVQTSGGEMSLTPQQPQLTYFRNREGICFGKVPAGLTQLWGCWCCTGECSGLGSTSSSPLLQSCWGNYPDLGMSVCKEWGCRVWVVSWQQHSHQEK